MRRVSDSFRADIVSDVAKLEVYRGRLLSVSS